MVTSSKKLLNLGNVKGEGVEGLYEPEDQEVCCEVVSPRNGREDKPSTTWLPKRDLNRITSTDMLTRKTGIYQELTSKDLQTTNDR